MKQLKHFTTVLSTLFLMGLFTGCGSEQLDITDDIQPKPQEVSYKSLRHTALGNAVLETRGEGPTQQLTVSKAEDVQEDGVRIDLAGHNGLDLYFEPVAIPAFGEMQIMAVDQATEEPFSGIRLSNGPEDQKQIEVFIADQDTLLLEGFRDGERVFTQKIESKERWWWVVVAAVYVLDHASAHYEWHSDGSSSGGVDWNGTAPNGNGPGEYPYAEILLPNNDRPVAVDLLTFSSTRATGKPIEKAALEIKGGNLGSFTINDEVIR